MAYLGLAIIKVKQAAPDTLHYKLFGSKEAPINFRFSVNVILHWGICTTSTCSVEFYFFNHLLSNSHCDQATLLI